MGKEGSKFKEFISFRSSKHLERTVASQCQLAPRIDMSLNHLRFVFLLASTFLVVLCVPQASNQASKDGSNDEGLSTNAENLASLTTPSNIAYSSGTGFQDNSNSVALQGDGLETMQSTDSPLTGTEFLGGDPGRANLNS